MEDAVALSIRNGAEANANLWTQAEVAEAVEVRDAEAEVVAAAASEAAAADR